MTTKLTGEARRAYDEGRKQAIDECREIGQVCALAGKSHMAIDYIERGATPAEVRAELLDGRPMARVDLAADMKRRNGMN
jgi:hypothetical protein